MKIQILLLIVVYYFSTSCQSRTKTYEKEEVKNLLIASNTWFKSTKTKWQSDFSADDGVIDWKNKIIALITESNLFTGEFADNIQRNKVINNDTHFGLYFFQELNVGDMLKALCHEDPSIIIQELEKISENQYRYTTPFFYVLNSLPDINVDGEWQMYRGENGEVFQFSIVITKNNGKWAIDKFEMHEAIRKDIYK